MSYYNRTNTCERVKGDGNICGNKFHDKAYAEYNNDGNKTGRWICPSCYHKDRYKTGKTHGNLKKLIRNVRTGNQNPNCNSTKGDKSQELACIMYGWEDLNKKYDNYNSSIDCYDPKTGLYHQVQGRHFNSAYQRWSFSCLEKEWKKKFESMVCFCKSKDNKMIERIYKFSKEEIIGRTCISIVKNPTDSHRNSTVPWYEKYRIADDDELKKVNDVWNSISRFN